MPEQTRKTQRQINRQKANARHVAPKGAQTMARTALMQRTPEKHLQAFMASGQDTLQREGAFTSVGREQEQIVQYAGGLYIQHLPKSKAHRFPTLR